MKSAALRRVARAFLSMSINSVRFLGLISLPQAVAGSELPALIERPELSSSPFQFDVVGDQVSREANELQSQLDAFTSHLRDKCDRTLNIRLKDWDDYHDLWDAQGSATAKAACAWPLLMTDIERIGSWFAKSSPDSSRVNLTLAGALHTIPQITSANPTTLLHIDGVDMSSSGAYARLVFSYRLMRRLWPVARRFHDEGTDADGESHRTMGIEPWLTSLTPWSTFFNLMAAFPCRWSDETRCGRLKNTVAQGLANAIARTSADGRLATRVAAARLSRSIETEGNGSRRRRILDSALEALLGRSGPTHFALPIVEYWDPGIRAGIAQVLYFTHGIRADFMQRIATENVSLDSDLCSGMLSTLRAQNSADFPWLAELSFAPEQLVCQTRNVGDQSFVTWSGPLVDALRRSGKWDRAVALHVWTALEIGIGPQRSAPLDPRLVGVSQARRAITDIEQTVSNFQSLRYAHSGSDIDATAANRIGAFLARYAFEQVDRWEELSASPGIVQ